MEILVVDDHVLIRETLRGQGRCDGFGGLKFQLSDADHRGASQPRPHLLDLNLPDRDGFSVLTELRERYPAISVVVLSAQQDRGSVVSALDLGALGFIPKSGQREVMFDHDGDGHVDLRHSNPDVLGLLPLSVDPILWR